jgi:hypothetical protein
MSRDSIVIGLGGAPQCVRDEVDQFRDEDGRPITFSWDDEDNECMPLTARYLEETYRIFSCVII